MTEHFKRMVSKKCIGQSFEGVARELQLPASTVAHWFYEYADEALAQPEDYEAPKVVCLDEFALKKGHHYSVAILDAESGHVWHASPGKSREKIQAALRQYPFETAPEVVITDMAAGMDKTVHEVWPDAAVVVDKFHVIQLFTQALSSARKLEQSVERKFKRIRHQRRLLMTDPAHLENEEQEQLTVWLQQNQKLQTLYEALQDIRLFYASESYEQAESRLERWLEQYMYAGVSKLTAIGNTLLKWRQELMNYFYHRWTNAKIEGTNNLIKTLKRRSFGCPNLHKFVKRIRLECRQPA